MQDGTEGSGSASAADEAASINPNRYRNRRRAIYAVLLGAFLAGLVALVLEMFDARRNPCERLRDHLCAKSRVDPQCKIYEDILQDSLADESHEMRGQLRAQCETRIKHLAEDDGVKVP